jgi:hypothetical protein
MGAVLTKAEAALQQAATAIAATDAIGQPQRAETAAYIADLAATLAVLAREQKFDALGYLLDLVRLEAEGLLHGGTARPSQ